SVSTTIDCNKTNKSPNCLNQVLLDSLEKKQTSKLTKLNDDKINLPPTTSGKDRATQLHKLVKEPLNKYSKILGKDGDFEVHNKNQYHIDSIQIAEDFLLRYKNPHKEKVNSLLPTTSDINSTINKGNFRELLKLRILCGDSDLEKHLKSTHSKATYISQVIQNDIIECCKSYITEEIVKEIHESKYPYKGIIKECFMGFINCHDIYDATATDDDTIEQVERNPETFEPKLTGDILGEVVVNIMVSIAKGAVNKVQSHATNALHCPCSNHALNLSISKSSNAQVIRNTIGIVMDVISFFNLSSKRNFVLKKVLNHKPHLKSLCETRWVERHDCIMIFKSSLSDIVESLSLISNWQEQISSSKAKILLLALCTCEFINGLQCLSSVLCVTSKISRLLQAEWQDVCQTKEIVTDVINNLEEKRKNSVENFHELYIETKEIMLNLEVEEKLPLVDAIKKYYTFEDMDFIDLEEMNLKTEINLWKSKWIRIKDKVDIST
ncbi:zinc finger MYM-type protein 1-like, partial [Aphis craccivora]